MKLIGLLMAWSVLAQAPATVDGVVTDNVTRAPVAFARVWLARVDGPLTQSIVVNADEGGRFAIRNPPPGVYRAFADDPDHLRMEQRAPLTIRAGQAVTLAFGLTPTAVIAGRVLSERGDPAPKIYVRAWSADRIKAEAQTNDLGEYRLFALPPGSYTISAERYQGPRIEGPRYTVPTPPCADCRGEGQGMMQLTGLLTQGAFIDPRVIANRTYPPVFFPATTDRAAALPLEVGPGQQVGGIEIRLIAR